MRQGLRAILTRDWKSKGVESTRVLAAEAESEAGDRIRLTLSTMRVFLPQTVHPAECHRACLHLSTDFRAYSCVSSVTQETAIADRLVHIDIGKQLRHQSDSKP